VAIAACYISVAAIGGEHGAVAAKIGVSKIGKDMRVTGGDQRQDICSNIR